VAEVLQLGRGMAVAAGVPLIQPQPLIRHQANGAGAGDPGNLPISENVPVFMQRSAMDQSEETAPPLDMV
jgi:hypothetical protein